MLAYFYYFCDKKKRIHIKLAKSYNTSDKQTITKRISLTASTILKKLGIRTKYFLYEIENKRNGIQSYIVISVALNDDREYVKLVVLVPVRNAISFSSSVVASGKLARYLTTIAFGIFMLTGTSLLSIKAARTKYFLSSSLKSDLDPNRLHSNSLP